MNSQYRQSGFGLRGLRTYAPAKPGASFETCADPFCMECLTSPCAKAPKPSAQKPRIRCLLSDQKPRMNSRLLGSKASDFYRANCALALSAIVSVNISLNNFAGSDILLTVWKERQA
jgi:hypothetical protein